MTTNVNLEWLVLALMAASAAAQTIVTNSNNRTANIISVYTGSATLGNSPISISDGDVAIHTTSSTTNHAS
jgi:hypothetical protein